MRARRRKSRGNSIRNHIRGNYIGTDETGFNAWPNAGYGVDLEGGRGVMVGGANAGSGTLFPGNRISGNGLERHIYPLVRRRPYH